MTATARALVAVLLVGALSHQALAQYLPPPQVASPGEEGWTRQPVVVYVPGPAEPQFVYRPLTALWISGLIVLAAGWIFDIGLTAAFDTSSTGTAAIPVGGPWVQYGYRYSSNNGGVAQGLLATDGAIQLAGAAMLIVGLSIWRKQRVYERPRYSLAPILSPQMKGLSLSLSF